MKRVSALIVSALLLQFLVVVIPSAVGATSLRITSARVEIEDIEEAIGIKLRHEDEEIDTIGGLVMAISGCVPEKGEIIVINEDVVAEIIEATPRTIKQIKITYSS